MAKIGWIDFSPSHRDRVGTILDLLRPEGMVDELGIGIIRDALADQLFPGISTIQTRPKYFFIVPYLLHEYLRMKPYQRAKEEPEKYLERREYEVMWKLGDIYKHEEGNGVIGISKFKPEKIVRRPSTIYWFGISVFKLIETLGLGQQSYFASCRKPVLESLISSPQGDDLLKDDEDAEYVNRFRLKISYDPSWFQDPTLDLTPSEGEILRDRIISNTKNCLISDLLLNKELYKIFLSANNFRVFAEKAINMDLPERIKKTIILSHDFSELLYGAHIAYNCLVQRNKFNNLSYEENWKNWLENIQDSMLDFKNFDPEVCFSYAPTTRSFTRQFILAWWSFIKNGGQDKEARDRLIENQESRNKSAKARLRMKKFDDVKEDKWIGLDYLEYRFRNGKVTLMDIKSALGEK